MFVVLVNSKYFAKEALVFFLTRNSKIEHAELVASSSRVMVREFAHHLKGREILEELSQEGHIDLIEKALKI